MPSGRLGLAARLKDMSSSPVTGERDEEARTKRVAVDGGDRVAIEGQDRGQDLVQRRHQDRHLRGGLEDLEVEPVGEELARTGDYQRLRVFSGLDLAEMERGRAHVLLPTSCSTDNQVTTALWGWAGRTALPDGFREPCDER